MGQGTFLGTHLKDGLLRRASSGDKIGEQHMVNSPRNRYKIALQGDQGQWKCKVFHIWEYFTFPFYLIILNSYPFPFNSFLTAEQSAVREGTVTKHFATFDAHESSGWK